MGVVDMEMATAPRMFVSWPNYVLECIEKVLLGFSAFRTLSHGGAIGRFELLDDDAKKTFLEHFALHKGGTGGATWGHLLQRRIPANRGGAFSH